MTFGNSEIVSVGGGYLFEHYNRLAGPQASIHDQRLVRSLGMVRNYELTGEKGCGCLRLR